MSCSSKRHNELPLATKAVVLIWLTTGIFFWCLYVYAAISRDIDRHPRDIPDAGCYEYRKDNALEDSSYYIFANWLSRDDRGDFDHDGICGFKDFVILAGWWENRTQ